MLQECIFSGTQGLKALRRAWKTDESWEAQKKNASFSSLTPGWIAFRFHENSVIDPRGSITLFNDRNRRDSAPLSPIFSLFLALSGKLYLKVQDVLAHDGADDLSPPPMVSKRRPGPKRPKYGLSTQHWPMIFHRMVSRMKRSVASFSCFLENLTNIRANGTDPDKRQLAPGNNSEKAGTKDYIEGDDLSQLVQIVVFMIYSARKKFALRIRA